ncbi:glycosyl hydrolases family 31 protein [Glomus cerebriforme]|uniref:Glucosidase II subunit alpha n=1 Tax=Glomus cerebriforme TaxID=658196 RepID=A0A397SSA4_9GLOM|nr:glycosyl hydrolases family 31 protein [Glomus cerebriforme]
MVVTILVVSAVKPQDFRTCAQTSFCRRNRAYADKATSGSFISPYNVIKDTINIEDGIISGELINTENRVLFIFEIHILINNSVRIRINEKNPLKPRYDRVKYWSLIQEPSNTLEYTENSINGKDMFTSLSFGIDRNHKVIIYHTPFHIELLINDVPIITFNNRGFFNFEHLRKKDDPVNKPELVIQPDINAEEAEIQTEEEKEEKQEEGLWEETFNGKIDSKPNGPESIGLDISFPGFGHVYGIPEHTTTLSLKETRGGDGGYNDPYRLYNLDVFEYDLDSPTALYGSIPFMLAHRKGASAAILWLNAAETWIDIVKSKDDKSFLGFGKATPSTHTHWFSESGIIDVFAFLGPTTSDIFEQYGSLTGFTALPQSFAIGYHQCRWNYLNQRDVAEVDAGFDENDIPYDVIWLDIEHTDGKKYFTWDKTKFSDPEKMQKDIGRKGRKMVTIVDPHVKRDDNYYIYKEAKDLDILIKDKDGKAFDGWCWPGSSVYPDWTNPKAQDWFVKKFAFDQYEGSTEYLFIWNDMNEPAVFSGPEITAPKDLIHYEGWEHRNLHNLFGMAFHAATSQGLINRTNPNHRPFVLSRSFFVGSQRFGPIWTGDNFAKWDHLAASSPMLLTIGISGIPFSGADVGGFFGNPEPELLVRWYQTGAFQPFFRGHAHIDTKRREPWLFGEPYTSYIRDAIRQRYILLPFWYTLFQEASTNGMPIIRPMFVVFPDNEETFAMEDQYFVGNSLLVKPITSQGQTSTEVYFAGKDIYYDYYTFKKVQGSGKVRVDVLMNKIPVFLRGGSIIPRRQRFRRSSLAMYSDPFTLIVALNKKGEATGTLYLDDGKSYEYQKGHYIYRKFNFTSGKFTSTSLNNDQVQNDENNYIRSNKFIKIERIIILGIDKLPKKIIGYYNDLIDDKKELEFKISKDIVIIRNPKLLISNDWTIEFVN